MNWISENWVWILVGVAFVAMHMFGHGGHGGHGGHDEDNQKPSRGPSAKREDGSQANNDH
jgi:hypothetical protein